MEHTCPNCLVTLSLIDDFEPGDASICDNCGTPIVYRASGIFTKMEKKVYNNLSYEAKLQIEKVREAIKERVRK